MASIATYLRLIKNAVYGEDVRDSIHDAISAINDENVNVLDTARDYRNTAQNAAQAASSAAETATTANTAAQEAKETAVTSANQANNAKNSVVEVKDSIEASVAEAVEKATNADNHLAVTDNEINSLKNQLQNVSIDPDDLALEQDAETGLVYPVYKGVRSENGIPLAGSGGGGGTATTADFNATNTTGWLSKTISLGDECVLTFNWYSREQVGENESVANGPGTMTILVNEVQKAVMNIAQGNASVDVGPYLSSGSNTVKVRINDTNGLSKTIKFTIAAMVLEISTTFDASQQYSGLIMYPHTPTGALEKTIHYLMDGVEVGTNVTSVTGRQMTYTFPKQSHGAHRIECYFTCTINGETVRSNTLYHEIICIDPTANETIITSSFNTTKTKQFSNIFVAYNVYNPADLTAEVTIKVNDNVVSEQTVDRTQQVFATRADDIGTMTIEISSGGQTKTFTITVEESDIELKPVTDALALYLSSSGRSNNEANPATWEYNDIKSTFEGFNWTTDGWQPDEDGITVMRVTGDARLTIPYKMFATDFRTSGKTITLDFATSDVMDYDATIISCYSGGRGFIVTPQMVRLASEQSNIGTQYGEDEHISITFTVQKRSENRLILCYINSIPCGTVVYPDDDDFSQAEPVNITIGSNYCTTDIYSIRVYDNDLTSQQVLDNWIADTALIDDMLMRYQHNDVYDEYGNIVISKLPNDLPYMIIECVELPQYKGDKKVVNITYVDPVTPSRSFTATSAQADVQGTSSQYYERKNYKIKYKNGMTMTFNGTHVDGFAIRVGAIVTDTFTMKADVASSEGANNVELAILYNNICPYKTPGQRKNSAVRQGIDGFPMVIFWSDGENVTFLGKYNFNNDKGTEEVFGFVEGDESWEVLNNTSDRVLWKNNDFTVTMVDKDGKTIPAWTNDFEARYPEDNLDYTQLQEFATWVMSTDQSTATGDALASPVTYGETTYTNDTAEYRLAKFKAEAPDYMEMDSVLFYYLFTDIFLMVDSRAKNMFPSFIGSEVSA